MPTPILMPALSPTMEEGKLAKWLVKEGDAIRSGDVIAEIETDKATMEVEAVEEGTLGKIVIADDTDAVAVNAVIALMLADGEDASSLEGYSADAAPAAAPSPTPEAAAPAAAPSPTPEAAAPVEALDKDGGGSIFPLNKDGKRLFASPLARRIAKEAGLDISTVTGSGPHGRIVKSDVEAAIAKGPVAAPSAAASAGAPVASAPRAADDPRKIYPEGSYEEVPADNMRKTIARRLTQSFQEVPHFPLTVDCELDALLALRKELNDKAPKDGYKISVNDFVIKASALALKKVPDANATWAGDAILKHKNADIGVAVSIDGGLITPIVFAAETKGLATISGEMKDLAGRAREKKLQPAEYQGGTFSVSNLGMFGIKSFASIVNQPQGAILSVGAGEARPVVKDGALAIATIMSVTLTCDHRVVDGSVGALFCQAFKGYIEDPVSMML